MKLKDFVEQSLLEICEGVESAKTKTKIAIAPGHLNSKKLEEIHFVKFRVAVTTTSSTEGGIKVFSSGASGQLSQENTNQIEFDVPVIFNSYIK
ncbi:MAG: hypothetical protein K9G62_06115 [Alphaproteobacteria bacterium]|nr:hypothetical protein [Alphaproteobacteria bacterium]